MGDGKSEIEGVRMPTAPSWRLTDFASCAGCAGKIAPGAVGQLLEFLPKQSDPNLLVGTETHDDAGVYRLTDEIALVQTVDFFPPVVDDPFVYGQIAAANALSDIYAMGGIPKTVLNLVGYPDDEIGNWDWLGEILRGSAERCAAAGAAIVGGHSVRDREIKFGLAATGIVHPKQFWTNAGARPGDKLVLTKPLGTGFVTAAAKKDACPKEVFQAACSSMVQLNAIGRDALLAVGGAHAVTDVTGFGLCGHGLEMAQGSGVTIAIDLERLPTIHGVEQNGLTKFRTRANRTNWDYVKERSSFEGSAHSARQEFLSDPQTSGGLLISVEGSKANALVAELIRRGAAAAAVIGEVRERGAFALIFQG
jgi:selenide, water dikinase